MKKIRILVIISISILCLASATANGNELRVSGTVVGLYDNSPVRDAVINVSGMVKSVTTNQKGEFVVDSVPAHAELSVWSPGYYVQTVPLLNRNQLRIILLPESMKDVTNRVTLPFLGTVKDRVKGTNLKSVPKKSQSLGMSSLEDGFRNVPGLELISKSGVSSEGSYFNIRGVNSLSGATAPLIVINGVPYLSDMNESGVIGGYSKTIFSILNIQDIDNITVLKGSEATQFGSLGSNGVIMIETDKAVDLNTKVEFIGQYGFSANSKKYPVLDVAGYKSLMGNIANTKYEDPDLVLTNFPYLKDDPNYFFKYLYNNNTDWQDQIFQNGFVTDNVLKIKGGDAIAKYDFSIGVKNNQGVIKETSASKYYARMNADVNLSKQVVLFSTISFAYTNNLLQEQGMLTATNPLLAALKKGPIFSPNKKDEKNNILPELAFIYGEDGKLIENNSISNPLSIVKNVAMKEHAYDVLLNAGLQYSITNEISLRALFGVNYNLKHEEAFVPGVSNRTIMPLSTGLASNTVRVAKGSTMNTYYALNGQYVKQFDHIHKFEALLGGQVAVNQINYNAGFGRNTTNDFYKTLDNVSSIGRSYQGYIDRWNWMNYNLFVRYGYQEMLFAGVVAAVDATSTTGTEASLFQVYPAVNVAWSLKNSLLKEYFVVNDFKLRAEYAVSGNSRYSSSYGEYQYLNRVFRNLSGLVRDGVPNLKIVPERTRTVNVGTDLALFNRRVNLTLDYYSSETSNMLLPIEISSVYGQNYQYQNKGTLLNSGIEMGVQLGVIQNRDIKWYVGGTFAMNESRVKSLGGESAIVMNMADGSALITEEGQPLYSFYGYKTNGVFAKDDDVINAGKDGQPLVNAIGIPFEAGDVHFVDANKDGKIDSRDRQSLGSTAPQFFGSLYTSLQYRGFELSANFGYASGNKMYNAVRREMEGMKDFSNQLSSVSRRWVNEGQVTDIPRSVYGDPMENSRFSDRWIEDASCIKLKELILSYSFKFLGQTTVFASAENLVTFTRYLGLDPETMYSYNSTMRGFDYGKVAAPRTFKFGVKLQF